METNPKQLGNTWEREFCKDLSLWWTKGRDDRVFWRSDSSGAVKGVSELAGDVKAIKQIGYPLIDHVIIETKRTKDTDVLLEVVRRGKSSKIGKWWDKLLVESDKWKRDPMLVIKLVNRTVICIYRVGYLVEIDHCFEYDGNPIVLWKDFEREL